MRLITREYGTMSLNTNMSFMTVSSSILTGEGELGLDTEPVYALLNSLHVQVAEEDFRQSWEECWVYVYKLIKT